MCMVVYIASRSPLPLIPFEQNAPAFNVTELIEPAAETRPPRLFLMLIPSGFAPLPLPLANDKLVRSVAVEITCTDGVPVGNRLVSDMTFPRAVLLSIRHDLVPVPRLDGGQKALTREMADDHIARAALRPFRRTAADD